MNQNGEYTKHYYADAARIASKIGSGFRDSISTSIVNDTIPLYIMQKELSEVANDTIENISCDFVQLTHLQGDSCKYENAVYFYHGNHLSSTQLVTDMYGSVVQGILYAPFGEIISEYNSFWHQDIIPNYCFSAKELDEESGMYYFEARYYAPPVFISRDPLFEKYPFMSPYAYCANNPLRYVDPTGMEIDDYFNLQGKYLGSDKATTDKVKIIDQATWDANKTVDEHGTESINHKIGNANSTNFSEKDMSKEAALSVYQHYNPTDLKLNELKDSKSWGMQFYGVKVGDKESLSINIRIEGNKKTKVSDHANEIINMFSHEEKHYNDFKKVGFEKYLSMDPYFRERRAISAQMKHESWSKTRPKFRHDIETYGIKNGRLPHIPSKKITP